MNSKPTYKQAILLLTDKDAPVVEQQYQELRIAASAHSEVLIAYHQKGTTVPLSIEKAKHFIFTDRILISLGYNPLSVSLNCTRKLLPGSNHFPLLQFYMENPNYEYYWVIEDDVRFNGNWKLLFDTYLSVSGDFITCHICDWAKEPEWPWWLLLHNGHEEISLNQRVRSFNPIYRISNNALKFLDNAMLDGWTGHHEVLMPTLLKRDGFRIIDFGGNGKYVLPGFTNRFYTSANPNTKGVLDKGTMRFRPIFNAIQSEPNKLYHPVKDFYAVAPPVINGMGNTSLAKKSVFEFLNTTFIFLVRLDTIDRLENILTVIKFLLQNFETNIVVLECASFNNGLLEKVLNKTIQYSFQEDPDPILFRTKYLNQMIQSVETPFVAVWDTDVIVPASQIVEAVELCWNKMKKR
jgi:hypothetical protein